MKIFLAIALVFVLSACTQSDSPEPVVTPDDTLTLTTADFIRFGKVIVTDEGFPVYMFTGDDGEISNCNICPAAFEPVMARDQVFTRPASTLSDDLIGVNGAGQVIYNDHLLYRFKYDILPGDLKGVRYQDGWFLLNSDGNPLIS